MFHVRPAAPSRKISDIMASPVQNLPVTVFPASEYEIREQEMIAEERGERERERMAITFQVTNAPK